MCTWNKQHMKKGNKRIDTSITMHPERVFLARELTALCAQYISVVRKLKETANAHKQTRTPPIGISLAETSLRITRAA